MVVIVLLFSVPSGARACDKASEAKPDSTCVVMARGDKPGVWFALKEADELRRFKLEIPELRLQLQAHGQRAELRDYQAKTYQEVIALKDAALKTAEGALQTFARDARQARTEARKAEDELGAWYRSPVLWTGVGAAIITGIVVALEIR